MPRTTRVLSCIQPTGMVHLGNYLGSIRNWIELQNEHHCLFGIANYHAMTMPYEADSLRKTTIDLTLSMVACGIQPENLFIQSLVPERLELAWILSSVTRFESLESLFLARQQKLERPAQASLFQFPLLQGADILLHRANTIPVGRDLLPFLEVIQNLARDFNAHFGVSYFEVPQPLLTSTADIRSIQDPTQKMSKSLGLSHCIGLFEEPVQIKEKIKSLGALSEQRLANLKTILHVFRPELSEEKLTEKQVKAALTACLIDFTESLRISKAQVEGQSEYFLDAVRTRCAELRKEAQQTLKEVKELVGLMS